MKATENVCFHVDLCTPHAMSITDDRVNSNPFGSQYTFCLGLKKPHPWSKAGLGWDETNLARGPRAKTASAKARVGSPLNKSSVKRPYLETKDRNIKRKRLGLA